MIDSPNNRQNTIPAIPAININIIIYQWIDAFLDERINSKRVSI